MRQILVLALIIFALALVIRAERDAPDPRAQCDNRPTKAERDQCRSAVDFAMSAGW